MVKIKTIYCKCCKCSGSYSYMEKEGRRAFIEKNKIEELGTGLWMCNKCGGVKWSM